MYNTHCGSAEIWPVFLNTLTQVTWIESELFLIIETLVTRSCGMQAVTHFATTFNKPIIINKLQKIRK